VKDADSVRSAADELTAAGYKLLHGAKTLALPGSARPNRATGRDTVGRMTIRGADSNRGCDREDDDRGSQHWPASGSPRPTGDSAACAGVELTIEQQLHVANTSPSPPEVFLEARLQCRPNVCRDGGRQQ
jgi:hypothetical protein